MAAPLLGASASLPIKPTVIIYPFVASTSSVDREASARLATIIASQMANAKNVTVIPAPPGTERKDYLRVAKEHNADFYVAGFISPLGEGVSVVEQVVTTRGGIVAFSNTAQLQTYADAAGQGDTLAQAIATYANRGFASLPTPPPAASPTPSANGPHADIGRILGGRVGEGDTSEIRGRQGARGAAPASGAPAPATSALPGAGGSTALTYDLQTIAVLPVGGTAGSGMRQAATLRLAAHEPGAQADTLQAACAAHPRATILRGELATKRGRSIFTSGKADATFSLTVTDCSGAQLWRTSKTKIAGTERDAMDDAIDAAVAEFDQAKAQAETSSG